MSTATNSLTIRRAEDRGKTELRWLHGRHSFSFGRYYDPNNLGYRSLRVINDDIVEPASGFGEHGHDNMEILTWVLEGTLHHRDSTGTDGDLRPGELQAMTAGRGIRHSEVNDSPTERVHLLQIWIEPDTLNLTPAYAQKPFPREGRRGQWQMLASPDGRDDSMRIHQDAILSVAELGRERAGRARARPESPRVRPRGVWLSPRRRHDAQSGRRRHIRRPRNASPSRRAKKVRYCTSTSRDRAWRPRYDRGGRSQA